MGCLKITYRNEPELPFCGVWKCREGSKELKDLYDHLARWYDPHWGLGYTGQDILADAFSSWSPYQYAYRNPLRYVDKTGMAANDVTGGGPCGDKPCPENTAKTGDAGVTGAVKIGLAFGVSFKVGGENLSIFVDFGSVELVSFNNSTVNKGVKETEGIELGFGPVGIQSTVETITETKNGELTKTETQTVGGNLFNVDMKEESTTVTKNPGSPNNEKVKKSKNSSTGVSQGAKVAFFGTLEVSIGANSYNQPMSINKKYDNTYPSDNTRVVTKKPILIPKR